MEVYMVGYIKAEEAAKRWDITSRHVQRLCTEGRIDGAVKFGTTWAIPENSAKPTRMAVNGKPGRKPKQTN
jgi:hypothetical protein